MVLWLAIVATMVGAIVRVGRWRLRITQRLLRAVWRAMLRCRPEAKYNGCGEAGRGAGVRASSLAAAQWRAWPCRPNVGWQWRVGGHLFSGNMKYQWRQWRQACMAEKLARRPLIVMAGSGG